ncbi:MULTISPECIES: hypothetical protein [unclassified Bifidobacterium]|uniref:hypothetical protein n=1 Tax=unclassified Bifidobacterium TaxID=2608897 RepID=UPI00215942F9|nr:MULTISPECIES: hypothetical protein [unclassified Bifidobacterium]
MTFWAEGIAVAGMHVEENNESGNLDLNISRRSRRAQLCRKKKGHFGRNITVVCGVLFAVLVMYAVLLHNAVCIVKTEMAQAVDTVASSGLSAQLASVAAQGSGIHGDAIESAITQLQGHGATARAQTDGFVWHIATVFPVVGDDFAAV